MRVPLLRWTAMTTSVESRSAGIGSDGPNSSGGPSVALAGESDLGRARGEPIMVMLHAGNVIKVGRGSMFDEELHFYSSPRSPSARTRRAQVVADSTILCDCSTNRCIQVIRNRHD